MFLSLSPVLACLCRIAHSQSNPSSPLTRCRCSYRSKERRTIGEKQMLTFHPRRTLSRNLLRRCALACVHTLCSSQSCVHPLCASQSCVHTLCPSQSCVHPLCALVCPRHGQLVPTALEVFHVHNLDYEDTEPAGAPTHSPEDRQKVLPTSSSFFFFIFLKLPPHSCFNK